MKNTIKIFLTSSLMLALALSFNFAEAQIIDENAENTTNEGENVVEVVKSNEDHSKFAELLEESDMGQVLSSDGPFTVLVPTDEALESETDVEQLKENPEQLQEVVASHLYQGELPSDRVSSALEVEVVEGDKNASNGVVHFVDEVVQRN